MVNKNYDSEFIEVVISLEDKCGRIHGTGNTPEDIERENKIWIKRNLGVSG